MSISELANDFNKIELSILENNIRQCRHLINTTYLGQVALGTILAFNICALARNIEYNTLMYCPVHIMGSMVAICAGATLQYIKVKTKIDKQEHETKIKSITDKISKFSNTQQTQGKTL